jgi:hypothetical protein
MLYTYISRTSFWIGALSLSYFGTDSQLVRLGIEPFWGT